MSSISRLFRRKIRFLLLVSIALLIRVILIVLCDNQQGDSSPALPHIAYLYPADARPENIWIANPFDGTSARQVTFSPSGIVDFAVSPDGKQIAFAERDLDTGTSSLYLLDLGSNATRLLVQCVESGCKSPVWRPDGRAIAYERDDLSTIGANPERIWLFDMSMSPPVDRPLFENQSVIGQDAQWSADASQIAIYDSGVPGIVVYDLQNDTSKLVPGDYGGSGSLSPHGMKLVYTDLVIEEQSSRSYLRLANLVTDRLSALTDPDEPIDDTGAVWNPDGRHLAFTRRYTDNRYTQGRQVYVLDIDSGIVEPLIVDERYNHAALQWDAVGSYLAVQRLPELKPEALPEIWVYDIARDELVQIAKNAFYPRWVP